MVEFPNLVELHASRKLSNKFSGPFKIVKVLPRLNYLVNSGLPNAKDMLVHVKRIKLIKDRPDYLIPQSKLTLSQVSLSDNTTEPNWLNEQDSFTAKLPITEDDKPVDNTETTGYRTRSGRLVKTVLRN